MDLANNNFTHVADLDERGVTLERDGKRLKFIPWGEDAEARAAASAAQAAADAAQETADTAQTTADTAETKADAAQAAAETADGKAEAAQEAADAAQETADTAQTTADTAETKADAAQAAAETADGKAEAAQAAAETADGKAEAAQAAADGLEPRVAQLEEAAGGLQQEVYEAHQEAVQAQTTADAAQAAAETADGKADAAQTAASAAQETADAAQELAQGAVQQVTPEGVTEQRAGLKLKAQNGRWQIGQTDTGSKWGVLAIDDNNTTIAECIAFPSGDKGKGYGRLNLTNSVNSHQLRLGYSENGKLAVPSHVRQFDPGTGATVTLEFQNAIMDYRHDLCTYFIGVYTGEYQGAQLSVLAAGAYDRSTKVVTPGSLLAPFAKVTG